MKNNKVTARLGLIYIFVCLIPGLVLLNFAMGNLRGKLVPLYGKHDNGSYFTCESEWKCVQYGSDLYTSDTPLSMRQREEFEEMSQLLKNKQTLQISEATVMLILIALPVVFIYGTLYIFNSITYVDGILKLRVLVAPTERRNLFVPTPRFHWDVNTKLDLPVDKIKELYCITTTPLSDAKTSIDQLNWRDELYIVYEGIDDNYCVVRVNLFLFPKFKEIVKVIVESYPSITVTFNKESLELKMSRYRVG